ncbi:MAG: HlyD family efflux transporter periplasmic adaptor subunit [Candidatus Riflebacteria bacterium]
MSEKDKKSNKPLIFAAIIAAIFVSVAFWGLSNIRARQSMAEQMPQKPLAVKTIYSQKGVLLQKIPALATVKSAATIMVKAEIAGRIISMPMREGDHFKKGDLLAIIDGREQQAQLSAAQARSSVIDGQIASIRANIKAFESQKQGLKSNFDFLESELQRYEKLFTQQAISASAIEAHRNKKNDAESKLLSLDAQIQSQKAQIATLESQKQASRKEVDLWQVRKDYSEIIAEVDGVISVRHQEEGNHIMPGAAIMTIDDTSHLRLIMQLPQTAAGQIEAGQSVILNEYPDASFVLTRIYPALNDFRQFVVEAQAEKMNLSMKFDLQIPASIVVKRVEGTMVDRTARFINFNFPEQNYVYLIEESIARRISLKPLLISAEGHAVFDTGELAPNSLLAAGSYLENVRLPASFPIEALK